MVETFDLVLEHLKKIQTEQTASRERDGEIVRRLAGLETMIAHYAQDKAQSGDD